MQACIIERQPWLSTFRKQKILIERKLIDISFFVGSSTPFHIRVQFGPGLRDESPEDNLGMCLKYEQLPCVS